MAAVAASTTPEGGPQGKSTSKTVTDTVEGAKFSCLLLAYGPVVLEARVQADSRCALKLEKAGQKSWSLEEPSSERSTAFPTLSVMAWPGQKYGPAVNRLLISVQETPFAHPACAGS